jgi:hypothetical protein
MNSENTAVIAVEIVSISADECAKNTFTRLATMAISTPTIRKRESCDRSRLTTVASEAMPKNTAAVPPKAVMMRLEPLL